MSATDLTMPCPQCSEPVGGHTIDGYRDCLHAAGADYELPFAEVSGGPVRFAQVEGWMVGEIAVAAAVVDFSLGKLPALQFRFSGPGEMPMSRHTHPPFTLVLDASGLLAVKHLVIAAVDKAISEAEKAS